MEQAIAYYNGKWMPKDECKLPMDDRGFHLGDALYEAERTFGDLIFGLDLHMDRLFRSLTHVRIDPRLTKKELSEISYEVVKRNEHLRPKGGDFNIRQTITRGRGGSVISDEPPTVFVSATPMSFERFGPLYDKGCHVVFAKTRSYHPDSLDPKVKHQSRMNFVLASLEAHDVDPESYPVLLDLDGNISEGTGFNFWIVTDGVLRTAGDRSILQGISRTTIIELARELDIPVVEEELQLYDAYNADEAFISGTSPCLLPASKIDNRPIGDDMPGPIVKRLLAAWSEKVGVDIVGQARSQVGLEP